MKKVAKPVFGFGSFLTGLVVGDMVNLFFIHCSTLSLISLKFLSSCILESFSLYLSSHFDSLFSMHIPSSLTSSLQIFINYFS